MADLDKLSVLERLAKIVIAPLIVSCLTIYLNYKIDREKIRADAGYGAVAPAMKEVQDRVASLDKQMQVLQQLVLAQTVKPQPVAPSATIETNLAIEKFKKDLTVRVQKSQSQPLPAQKPLPAKLDDLPGVKK